MSGLHRSAHHLQHKPPGAPQAVRASSLPYDQSRRKERHGRGRGVAPLLLPGAAQEKMSPLNPDLPLAATRPAACGVLTASQMGAMPGGGADTGVEGAAQADDNAGLITAGAAAMIDADADALALRRRAAGAR